MDSSLRKDLRPFFREFALPALRRQKAKLLVAGCGNSRLSNEIYDDLLGQDVDVWNVDYAEARHLLLLRRIRIRTS